MTDSPKLQDLVVQLKKLACTHEAESLQEAVTLLEGILPEHGNPAAARNQLDSKAVRVLLLLAEAGLFDRSNPAAGHPVSSHPGDKAAPETPLEGHPARGVRSADPSGHGWEITPLTPELREWLLQDFNEEEVLADFREVREKGGLELHEFIQELEQVVCDHERAAR
jgi:hypothetical protein